MIRFKNNVLKLTIRITFVLLLVKGLSLLGKEGDYEYFKETRYDKFGQITHIYESIYIPPVTQEVDGGTIFLSPGYFAERFEKPEKMDSNLPLTQILTDKWEKYNWDNDFDDESWRKEIKSLPGTNEFSNLRVMKKSLHNKYRSRLHYYEKGKNIYGFD